MWKYLMQNAIDSGVETELCGYIETAPINPEEENEIWKYLDSLVLQPTGYSEHSIAGVISNNG